MARYRGVGRSGERVKLSSVRKSFLSALYGIYVRAGRLDLSKTLDQLAIDDRPPLTATEKTGDPSHGPSGSLWGLSSLCRWIVDDREAMPPRGSHPPGSFWYYNNWDFNVLGTVFEQQLHLKIATEFRDRIAAPIQMQDFRLDDMHYFGGTTQTATVEQSIHPVLPLQHDGTGHGALWISVPSWWGMAGRQVIPANWVTESTTSYSDTGGGGGYGYLWWVNGFSGVSVANYSARGALGKYIVIFPDPDLVVVYQNHTEFPDDAAAYPSTQLQSLPNVSAAHMGGLLKRVLDAQPPSTRQGGEAMKPNSHGSAPRG